MLFVKVLGPGCANCERLEQMTVRVVEQLKGEFPELEATVEKITDIERFADYGLLATPGLVVNEKLVSSGRVPAEAQLMALLRDAVEDYK
jgi:small redox-active disulfide protein 2